MNDLIYDRTLQDILNKTNKGYYNVSDLNRINNYISLLNNYLDLGLTIETFELGQAITIENINLILYNISVIKDNWYVSNESPNIPIAVEFNYNSANAIEKILSDSHDFMLSVKSDILYSGEIYSGEVRL